MAPRLRLRPPLIDTRILERRRRPHLIVTKRLSLETKGDGQIIALNDEVVRQSRDAGIAEGIVTVFVPGTTAGVTIMEHEPGLVLDLAAAMNRLFPRGIEYQHDVLNADTNGHSHTRATLIGPSLVVPIAKHTPLLGTWQEIVMIDFDSRPRSRDLILQFMGE